MELHSALWLVLHSNVPSDLVTVAQKGSSTELVLSAIAKGLDLVHSLVLRPKLLSELLLVRLMGSSRESPLLAVTMEVC